MPRSPVSVAVLVCLGLVAAGERVLAQTPLRVGAEFQVNTYTVQRQYAPAVASDTDGDFVVVWESRHQDGDNYGVFARRFDSSGTGLGTEFQVNSYTSSTQRTPAVARSGDGAFVVVWRGDDQGDLYSDIFAQRFDAAGTRLGAEFQVNSHSDSFELAPTVAMETNGDFVVAWASNTADPGYGIRAQRFASTGGVLGAELQVNTITVEQQKFPSLAMDADGDFVIAWTSQSSDGESYGAFARRFASSGTAVGGDFQINTYTQGAQIAPAAAMDAGGDFVVTWRSYPQDGSAAGIFARRFASSGGGLGPEFQVNTYTTGSQAAPAVGIDADGDFVVAWESLSQEGVGSYGVFARRFSSAGNALGVDFQVNSFTAGSQSKAAVASAADGDFVVAWNGDLQDGDYFGVFAQRFTPLATLDIDGNGQIQPLTDGLLFLRYTFQFSGTVLTANAVGPGCTRCDAAAILSYLSGLGAQLDIDGSGGPIQPLTDGLLVLRFTFGFSGTVLTANAVAMGSCSRCDHTEILPYLKSLL